MNYILYESDMKKLKGLVSRLDIDMQVEFEKVFNTLTSPFVPLTPDDNCPPEKIMVDRRKFEDMLQDLNKSNFED